MPIFALIQVKLLGANTECPISSGDVPAYAWVAAERKTVLPHDLGWPAESYSIVNSWTAELAEWNEAWKALDPAIKAKIDDLWASSRDREDGAIRALNAR